MGAYNSAGSIETNARYGITLENSAGGRAKTKEPEVGKAPACVIRKGFLTRLLGSAAFLRSRGDNRLATSRHGGEGNR